MSRILKQEDWHMRSLTRRLEWLQERKLDHQRIEVDVEWLEQLLMENLGLHQAVGYYRDMTASAWLHAPFIAKNPANEEKA